MPAGVTGGPGRAKERGCPATCRQSPARRLVGPGMAGEPPGSTRERGGGAGVLPGLGPKGPPCPSILSPTPWHLAAGPKGMAAEPSPRAGAESGLAEAVPRRRAHGEGLVFSLRLLVVLCFQHCAFVPSPPHLPHNRPTVRQHSRLWPPSPSPCKKHETEETPLPHPRRGGEEALSHAVLAFQRYFAAGLQYLPGSHPDNWFLLPAGRSLVATLCGRLGMGNGATSQHRGAFGVGMGESSRVTAGWWLLVQAEAWGAHCSALCASSNAPPERCGPYPEVPIL